MGSLSCFVCTISGSYTAFLNMRFLKTFGKEVASDVFISVRLGGYFKGRWFA